MVQLVPSDKDSVVASLTGEARNRHLLTGIQLEEKGLFVTSYDVHHFYRDISAVP
jgi:hypothetical protein